jgi:hypothetical protein
VDLARIVGQRGDVREKLLNRSRAGRGPERPLLLWNFIGDLNRVLANGTKAASEIFSRIWQHAGHSWPPIMSIGVPVVNR